MINIGNIFALLALLSWPLISIMMFRSMPLARALIWSILGAYMFLPQLSAINFPLIPPLNKESIPNLTAFAICMSTWGRLPSVLPRAWVGRGLVVMFILSPVITVVTNLEPIQFGVDRFGSMTLVDPNDLTLWGLPGLRIYDSASALVQQVFFMLPFFLAREALGTRDGMREILLALVIAGGIYALPMLYEVRFSPQLHTRIYGFFQHDFIQAIRQGGFRPFVFMPHGLWVAFFAVMVTLAAAARTRIGTPDQWGKRMLYVGFGFGLVIICKSMGPLMYALAFVPFVLLFKPRLHVLAATVLVTLVIAYPLLRGAGWVPTDWLLAQVEEMSPDRAQSLGFRFGNEDSILAHVADKPLFGWGGWGRFMVYDAATGQTQTIVDGQWIITIGQFGWLGYIALFGLMALPIYALAYQARRRHAAAIPIEVSVLVLILAINMVDMLPNATLIPFTWLIAGALLGYAEEMKRATDAAQRAAFQQSHAGVMLGTDLEHARDRRRGAPVPARRRTLL
ncbi:hypothetical protein [Pararhodobacter sp. CCB-MM2]|uniref:hypothetical protein n=1 Tax=Pararhodobacter sp. CCB-MM2 TaxID=1786003 RepID=UPI00082E4753|nr:hypothetical protein [Pararhodobacter sp. CCB-MM2]